MVFEPLLNRTLSISTLEYEACSYDFACQTCLLPLFLYSIIKGSIIRGFGQAAQMCLKLEDLAKKIAAGFTDKEIMADLNLKRRTFYYYKAKVCMMFGNIPRVLPCKKTEQVLEFEAEILKDRFIRLYRNLEHRATNRSTKFVM